MVRTMNFGRGPKRAKHSHERYSGVPTDASYSDDGDQYDDYSSGKSVVNPSIDQSCVIDFPWRQADWWQLRSHGDGWSFCRYFPRYIDWYRTLATVTVCHNISICHYKQPITITDILSLCYNNYLPLLHHLLAFATVLCSSLLSSLIAIARVVPSTTLSSPPWPRTKTCFGRESTPTDPRSPWTDPRIQPLQQAHHAKHPW